MKILVCGGDGFCGWANSLHLSLLGHDITIVDNLVRRIIDGELGCGSLTPIRSIETRISTWKQLTGKRINFLYLDVAKEYNRLLYIIKSIQPDAIIHFAEQRSAPYSMRSPQHKCYTVTNNVNATHNILCSIVESGLDIHLIHIGTTGYYGYSSIGLTIPEGYLDVTVDVDGEKKRMNIMYPPNPGSVYHMTKVQDAMMFSYYAKNDKLRITDLHQGIIWGTNTIETNMHENLINRFDYEGDFGTVANRFLMQSAVGHPITLYGTGGQTRAFIHIQDSVKCVKLAVENPPNKGDKVKIFNQTTECHNIKQLAEKIKKITGAEIRYYKNPRNEDAENELKFCYDSFKSLGLKPILLDDGLLTEVIDIAKKYSYRCDKSKIICTSVWDKNKTIDYQGISDEE